MIYFSESLVNKNKSGKKEEERRETEREGKYMK